MAVLASDWLRHFRLLLWNRWMEFNETWLEARSPCLYRVCVFWADWENKMAALASDWLRHFQLLLWNCWTEFDETWQEARFQCPLPSLCFSSRSEKQDGCPGSDWLRHFLLLLWNRWTACNETWQEERFQRPLPSFCFWADRKNKMPALANPSKRWHIVLRCTICGPLGLLFILYTLYGVQSIFDFKFVTSNLGYLLNVIGRKARKILILRELISLTFYYVPCS